MTISAALQAVLDDYALNERRSLRDAETRIRHLRTGLNHRAPLDTLTTAHLLAYAKGRRGAGRSAASVNRELSLLRRGFRLAGVSWYAPPRRAWKMLRENPPRQGFPDPAALERVLDELPAPEAGVIRFAALTGWRIRSEVLPLAWDQVDFRRAEVILRDGTTKSGEGRVFPLYPQLLALLECWSDLENGPLVFHRCGRPIRSFRLSWWGACRRAGVPDLLKHDLRRYAARNLIDAGVDRQTAMRLLGHKTESVFNRYRIVSGADLRRAAEALGRHWGEGRGGDQPRERRAATSIT
jgi:integrase